MTVITPLPTPPSRGMSAEAFITAANAFLAALPAMAGEFNAAFAALAAGIADPADLPEVKIAAGTVAAGAGITPTLSGYKHYRLVAFGLRPVTDGAALIFRGSLPAVSDFEDDAADYAWAGSIDKDDATSTPTADDGDSEVQISGAQTNLTQYPTRLELCVVNDGANNIAIDWRYTYCEQTTTRVCYSHGGARMIGVAELDQLFVGFTGGGNSMATATWELWGSFPD